MAAYLLEQPLHTNGALCKEIHSSSLKSSQNLLQDTQLLHFFLHAKLHIFLFLQVYLLIH